MREMFIADFLYGEPRYPYQDLRYGDLLVLIGALGLRDDSDLYNYLMTEYDYQPLSEPFFEEMIQCALRYYNQRIVRDLQVYFPEQREMEVFDDLIDTVTNLEPWNLENLTVGVYNVGNRHYTDQDLPLRDFFRMVYLTLLGQESGPRLPNFIFLLGRNRFLEIVNSKLLRG